MTTFDRGSDERTSAYLDGELSEIEQRDFLAELATSHALQRELDEVAAAREWVRSLPMVEPPIDLYEQLAIAVTRDRRHRSADRSRRRIRFGAAALVSVAAIWLLVLGLGWASAINDVSPELDALALRHGDRTQGSGGFVPVTSSEMAHMESPVNDPGATLVAAYHSNTAMQFVYDAGGGQVSVFRQSGHLAMGGMPADVESMEFGGMVAYATEMDHKKVVVVDAGDAVLTVVGDMDETERVMAMASSVSLVEQDSSLWARTRRGWDHLTDVVGI